MSTVLLVDDDAALRDMYQIELQSEGFTVLVAQDGEKGLQMALKEHPDVILLDIAMPKMDGMAMMKSVRQDAWGKHVPIILLTNLDTTNDFLKGVLESRAAYYLMKDAVTPEEVTQKIHEILKDTDVP